LTRFVRNGVRRYKHFRHEKYMFGCMLASGWLIVSLRACNALKNVE